MQVLTVEMLEYMFFFEGIDMLYIITQQYVADCKRGGPKKKSLQSFKSLLEHYVLLFDK